jgi:hypothetical protein
LIIFLLFVTCDCIKNDCHCGEGASVLIFANKLLYDTIFHPVHPFPFTYVSPFLHSIFPSRLWSCQTIYSFSTQRNILFSTFLSACLLCILAFVSCQH